jgi:hypothetical protein
MKTTITAQQSAFFTKNGFIEFEIPYALPSASLERDSWRNNPSLKQFLLKTLGPLALILTGKKQLRLGLDQWILSENRPTKAGPLKDLFCIQGGAIAAALSPSPIIPAQKSPLGILPLPSHAEGVLFFRTDLILDWPHVDSSLFLVLFTLPNAVYVQNAKDPATHLLKQLDYNFGDRLKNATHPLILSNRPFA